MAKIFLTTALIVLSCVLVGCYSVDSGSSQLLTNSSKITATSSIQQTTAGELDIIEKMTIHRLGYRQALQSQIDYYTQTGNNLKLQWTKKEMKAFHGLLAKRNECAHPTSFYPGLNESLGYVSELLKRIETLQAKPF